MHFYAPADLKTLSKHVLFALDISGSMGGKKIEQLREALAQILGDIGEGDFFTLVLFSDSVQVIGMFLPKSSFVLYILLHLDNYFSSYGH